MALLTETQAEELLDKYNPSDSLQKHGRAVRGVMKHFATLYGEDPEYWGQVGLLHDVDYEKYPDEHCVKAVEILSENGYDEEFIHAVVSHGWELCCDVEPELKMEKVLFATDELTGLITAGVYMRPDKNIMNTELKSVKKKFKTKSFAAGVDREVVLKGAEMLDMTLDELITETILGMREVADEIGLAGVEVSDD